jgi:hypothetical protein
MVKKLGHLGDSVNLPSICSLWLYFCNEIGTFVAKE